MRKLRIALGSADGKHISPTHFGDAQRFYLFTLEDNGIFELTDVFENTSPDEDGAHGREAKRKAVTAILGNTDIMAARLMSPNFRKIAEKASVQPAVVKSDDVDDVFRLLTGVFDVLYDLVLRRRRGEHPGEIPVLK